MQPMANSPKEIHLATTCNVSLILYPSTRICENLGWNCPELYDPFMIVYLLFIIIRWALSILIIILSQKIVDHDLLKCFTLNLFVVCIMCDVFLAIRQCIAVAQLYTTVFHSAQALVLFNAFVRLLSDAAAFEYRLTSLFVVFITYLLFLFPLKMDHFVRSRAYRYYFISMNFLTAFACLPQFLIYIVQKPFLLKIFRYYHAVATYAAFFIIAVLLMLITFLALISLVRHRAMHVENEGKQRWRNLVSFLVYCIPLNLMNIPVCASAIALFLCGVFPKQMTCALFRFRLSCQGELFIVQVRTIIISLCTIIPLAPYRKAATQLICRKRNTQTSQSMEVTMAVNCLNSRRRCTFIAPSREAFGIDATLTQVEAYPYAR